jgi:hypothetical protein
VRTRMAPGVDQRRRMGHRCHGEPTWATSTNNTASSVSCSVAPSVSPV